MSDTAMALARHGRALEALTRDLARAARELDRVTRDTPLPTSTGRVLTSQVGIAASSSMTAAKILGGIAVQMAAHARAVEQVEASIRRIESTFREALRGALRVAERVRQVERMIPVSSLSPLMTVIGPPGVDELVRVRFFEAGTEVVSADRVRQARHIARSVGGLPAAGAVAWLSIPKLLRTW